MQNQLTPGQSSLQQSSSNLQPNSSNLQQSGSPDAASSSSTPLNQLTPTNQLTVQAAPSDQTIAPQTYLPSDAVSSWLILLIIGTLILPFIVAAFLRRGVLEASPAPILEPTPVAEPQPVKKKTTHKKKTTRKQRKK